MLEILPRVCSLSRNYLLFARYCSWNYPFHFMLLLPDVYVYVYFMWYKINEMIKIDYFRLYCFHFIEFHLNTSTWYIIFYQSGYIYSFYWCTLKHLPTKNYFLLCAYFAAVYCQLYNVLQSAKYHYDDKNNWTRIHFVLLFTFYII